MEFELHIKGTIEEISQITTLIEKKLERDKGMFNCLNTTIPTNINTLPVLPVTKKSNKLWRPGRHIDILIGSSESWFAIWKSYNSINAAAQAIWLKDAASIYYYLKNDRTYNGTYKFQYRDQ